MICYIILSFKKFRFDFVNYWLMRYVFTNLICISKPLTSKNVLSSSTVGLVPGTISEGGFKVVVEFLEFLGLSLTLKTSKKS